MRRLSTVRLMIVVVVVRVVVVTVRTVRAVAAVRAVALTTPNAIKIASTANWNLVRSFIFAPCVGYSRSFVDAIVTDELAFSFTGWLGRD